jgi:hypothetical protein
MLSVAWRILAGGEKSQRRRQARSREFPENFAEGVHYATVTRGNLRPLVLRSDPNRKERSI